MLKSDRKQRGAHRGNTCLDIGSAQIELWLHEDLPGSNNADEPFGARFAKHPLDPAGDRNVGRPTEKYVRIEEESHRRSASNGSKASSIFLSSSTESQPGYRWARCFRKPRPSPGD